MSFSAAEYPTGIYSDRIREYLAQGYLADEDYTKALERLQAIANPSAFAFGKHDLAGKKQSALGFGAFSV